MTKLRSLNARGIDEFRGFLQRIRDGEEFQANPAILYLDDYSQRLPRTIEIAARTFASKFEAAGRDACSPCVARRTVSTLTNAT